MKQTTLSILLLRIACPLASPFIPLSVGAAEEASPWSGQMEYILESDGVTLEFRVLSNGEAWRYELGKAGDPSTIWIENPEENSFLEIRPFLKTYSVRNLAPEDGGKYEIGEFSGKRPNPEGKEVEEPEINLAGVDLVVDIPCSHFKVKSNGPDTEIWIDPEGPILSRNLFRSFGELRTVAPVLRQFLNQYPGTVLKVTRKNWMGRVKFNFELVSWEDKEIEDTMFTIPGDFSQTGTSGRAGGPGGQGRPGGGRSGPGPMPGGR